MDAVEEIKRRIDVVEFVGRSVRLAKSGRNFKGLCPFHTEKTPSFYVFPDRGTWRCFGSCGEGGDIFTFAQKRDGVDFREALRALAAEAGIELAAVNPRQRERSDRLASIIGAAVEYYQEHLAAPEGADARQYLHETRGIEPATCSEFRLGWAPDTWRGLRDHLAGRGYDEADMVAAGVLVQPENQGQPYDRFRGRVIIPILDERGVFVGLGGRGLHGEEPKYLNSPQTDIFDKGRTLFGLNLAGKAIREAGAAVVVEGYMDVIGPWQAGFHNVVASMGTSLTERHAALLRRYTQRIVLAMDPDAAGLAAAERAGGLLIDLASPQAMAKSAQSAGTLTETADIDLRVALLPAGKDPDEITRDEPDTWRREIERARPFTEFLVDRALGKQRPDTAAEARRVVDRLRPILNTVSSPVERGAYIQRIARFLGVSEQAVWEQVRPRTSQRLRGQERHSRSTGAFDRETQLLGLFLRYPDLRSSVQRLPADLFNGAAQREAFSRWRDGADLIDISPEDPVYGVTREARDSRFLRQPLSHEQTLEAARNLIHEVLKERLMQRQAALTEEVAIAERDYGSKHVEAVTNTAWMGDYPSDEAMDLAQLVIEQLELGLSIHRQETPELV